MSILEYFPVSNKLSNNQQHMLEQSATVHTASKGALLHNGSSDCLGLFIIRSGRLRAYILSDEGKEITIYRLFDRDICLFSASCIMSSIQFDVSIEAETDSEFWIVPTDIYKKLLEESAAVANYTNQIMASRFSEVMWLIEQIMWKSMDRRLAEFLLEESGFCDSDNLHITHEKIANHLGTAREVITRMLRYFQLEGMVSLTRGSIELTNRTKLETLAK